MAFIILLALFLMFVAARYWEHIVATADTFMLAVGLLLTMVAGMFVRVLSENYRTGRELLNLTATQLIFPLLYALLVFYPIWSLANDAPKSLFTFYAAFLNGYFWESVVTAAKNSCPTTQIADKKSRLPRI